MTPRIQPGNKGCRIPRTVKQRVSPAVEESTNWVQHKQRRTLEVPAATQTVPTVHCHHSHELVLGNSQERSLMQETAAQLLPWKMEGADAPWRRWKQHMTTVPGGFFLFSLLKRRIEFLQTLLHYLRLGLSFSSEFSPPHTHTLNMGKHAALVSLMVSTLLGLSLGAGFCDPSCA
jgi:hypothetical protein